MKVAAVPNSLRLLAITLLVAWPVLASAQGAAISLGAPAADPNGPVEVTADSLRVDRTSGNAVFSGSVRVSQGDLVLTAAEVTVIYSEDADAEDPISEVIATGDVVLINGEDAAEAQRAVVRPAEDRVYLTGGVLLTQGRTIIAGDSMVLNTLTGDGVVEGRVRTVLATGDN